MNNSKLDKVLTSNVIRRCAYRLDRWIEGACGGAVCWDTVLEARMSRYRFLWCHWYLPLT